MTIGNRQDLLRPLGQPLVARPAVALWTMPIATGLVCDDLVCAVVTLLQVCAERSGTACADVSECLPLLARQYFSPAIQELLTVLAEDIGDFQPRLGHRRRPSSLPRSIGFRESASAVPDRGPHLITTISPTLLTTATTHEAAKRFASGNQRIQVLPSWQPHL